jgi:PAS domain S-box-containing protein
MLPCQKIKHQIYKLWYKLWQWRAVFMVTPTVAALVIAVNATGWLQPLELAALDLLFCLHPQEAPDSRIVIVTIDEPDIRYVGQWPMPDATLSELIEKIKQQQPRAIGLDLYRDLPVEPGNQQLVETFKSTPNLIAVDKVIGDVVDPPPVLAELDQVGIADLILDVDGKVRRMLMSHKDRQNKTRLSLGATLSLLYLKAENIDLKMIDGEKMHLGLGKALFIPFSANYGGYVGANPGGYQVMLNYRGNVKNFYTVSLTDVLTNQITPDLIPGKNSEFPLRDRIVLIGTVAPSIKDFFFTPYNSSFFDNYDPMPGVFIHANLISQVISAALDGRPLIQVWSVVVEKIWIFFWSLVGSSLVWLFRRRSPGKKRLPGRLIVSLLLAFSSILVGGYATFLTSLWIPIVRPLLSLTGSAIAMIVYHQQQLHRENEKKLAQILEAVPVGIVVVDPTGHPYFVNQKAQELLGKGIIPNATVDQLADVYQSYIAESDRLYPTENLPLFRALQGESTSIDDMEVHRNNQIIPLEVWGTPIYDDLRNIAYAIVAFQDISERKKAEADRKAFTEQLLKLNKSYQRFVPNQFLQILNKNSIIDVELGEAVQKNMTTLFSDIRDFTSLSENLSPEENFQFINAYLSCMEPAINQNNGFIDKYIGDAIMALFPGTPDDAVKAGIAMLQQLKIYNQKQPIGTKQIRIGIGINTGSMMLGTVGGMKRMDSTVISDAVNLGSRVETLTKTYGVSLLITQYTLLELAEPVLYHIRLIDRVKVKGKSQPVTIYEVFDGDAPEVIEGKLATRTEFEKSILLYHLGSYDEAEALFKKCLQINPLDLTIEFYLNRIKSHTI